MQAHFFQHVPFETLSAIEPWLGAKGYAIGRTAFYKQSFTLPSLAAIDLLIILGGSMSVNDEAQFPWLVQEKDFIRQAIAAGKPILGICLGAQLIASALGAKVYPNAVKEIGWFPIIGRQRNPELDLFQFPPSTEVFHWHGETFDLPPGAELIASSQACQHQAFQIGRSVIGLQCHLETTPTAAQTIVDNCAEELIPGPFVQDAATILTDNPARFTAMNGILIQLLEYLHRQVGLESKV
ncbi:MULTISPECIES: gamma-glutamyl-gamma-aminobutyrate hydrolase family protein [unclassified Synechocystis]|uniref:glutamine amidotransferase-related protein n=1 Tax=unclassified Synechocystis TaxID=2640012 RepID=UPI00040283AF|nr:MULTISPECIES: gamma-glutamyl-gamma-aminobutyrate hydrolase family protein [unclassified Synechocystis]AIE75423.1 Glutamine amidotransferase class-I [Synechocystis sp. PCC 6714]MCT0253648.1 gamma-glutamyl-gamma-aminobutyrate hydrolase family protein [Synechocystis sp. CS-94]